MPMNSIEATEGDTDLMAEFLAQRLLDVYQSEQVPAMVEEFGSVGFTKGSLIRNKDTLYRFVINAAYDGTPFTQGTGGYEHIWEMHGKENGVPSLLSSVGLWSIDMARNTPKHEIKRKLSRLNLGGNTMDRAGFTRFDDTVLDTCRRMTPEFQRQLILADSPEAIKNVFSYFTKIRGVAKTIASKLIKYLLREIAIGRAKPSDFPLSVVLPIKKEYHAKKAGDKLRKLNQNLVQRSAEILLQKGDPYAIDALFFLQRTKTSKFDNLIDELSKQNSIEPETRMISSYGEEVNAMSYAQYHDELAEVMLKYRGKTLNNRQIKDIFEESYPKLKSAWMQPSDHCIDHIVKGACNCAKTNRAIFSRSKLNTYVVR